MEYYAIVILKLLMAMVIGGIVGYERENLSRPAGIRTHAIVCIGAALIQMVSLDFGLMSGALTYDPFRLGAQVISGIGFLGAGTIIKEGPSVKGLTTAASIWTVACIGLSIGSGLYFEAAIAALFLMIALRALKILENRLVKNKNAMVLEVLTANIGRNISRITCILDEKQVEVLAMSTDYLDREMVKIDFLMESKKGIPISEILAELSDIAGIKDVKYKSAVGY